MAEVKPAVTVVDTLLRGVGQVMFQNNLTFARTSSGPLGAIRSLGAAAASWA